MTVFETTFEKTSDKTGHFSIYVHLDDEYQRETQQIFEGLREALKNYIPQPMDEHLDMEDTPI